MRNYKKQDARTEKEFMENLRTTREVLEDHVALSNAGRFEEDIQRNYHPKCLLLFNQQFYLGHAGLRAMSDSLSFNFAAGLPNFSMSFTLGRMGFLDTGIPGKDMKHSFMVEDGLIVTHVIHY